MRTNLVLTVFLCLFLWSGAALADVNFVRGQSIANDNGCGLALADLDGDGDMDIFVVCGVWNMGKPNKVYFNQGDGSFIDSGQSMGNVNSFGVALADLDEDGDIDAFVANGAYSGGNPNKVWLNDGTGHFTDSRQFLGHNNTGSVVLADLDGDGDLDAFACNHPIWQNNRNVGGGHRIWLNNGAGRFTGAGQDLGNAESRSVSLGDIDADGDLDALIANFRGYGNKFWLNDGAGHFTEGTQVLDSVESRKTLLADLDNDGDLDAFVTYFDNQNPSLCANKIWLNQGDGMFGDSGQRLGRLPTSGLALGDLDSDGDLDAFVINSVWQETRPDEIWLNDGHANFTNVNLDLGDEESVDVALADLDGDGDLDVVVVTPIAIKVWLNIREYLAQIPPGTTPQLFAPGIVSTQGNNEHTCSFSPDGTELFFTRDPERTTYTMKLQSGSWTAPERAHFTGREAIFTPDGNKLYYNDGDIWVTERTEGLWGEPRKVPSPVSSAGHDYYASFTSYGTMYFSRFMNGGQARIYRAVLIDGKYEAVEDVGPPINHPVFNCYHPFISPDESYIIFNSSDRSDGYGGADLYICFKGQDGLWREPVSMGDVINSDSYDLCPVVTFDGKYLFFTRLTNRTGNIYWVSAEIIDELR
jgi:hypothetical protein